MIPGPVTVDMQHIQQWLKNHCTVKTEVILRSPQELEAIFWGHQENVLLFC